MGLETVELVISWEQEFGLKIPNKTARTMVTPLAAGNVIEDLLGFSGRVMDRSSIDAIIKNTTLEISGMNSKEYRMDGRFVEDFGLD